MTIVMETNPTKYRRIEEAIHYLEKNFMRQPSLDEVAEESNLSPYHFQKMFTDWVGISPKRFLQFLTVNFLKEKLQQSRNIIEAAESAGLSAQSRVYDLFTTLEAVTPHEYKSKGLGVEISYGFHETPFGKCLLGTTERGVCWLSFLQHDEDENLSIHHMKAYWHNSAIREDTNETSLYLNRIFPEGKNTVPEKLNVLVKGTNFQIKVWEALLKIPAGKVTTYQDIAREIDNPNALQAVGSAVGANHIAYLIPCHRVIRKDGILGEYRWGSLRKKSMIGWEMAKKELKYL